MKSWNELSYKEKLAAVSLYPNDAKHDDNYIVRKNIGKHFRSFKNKERLKDE